MAMARAEAHRLHPLFLLREVMPRVVDPRVIGGQEAGIVGAGGRIEQLEEFGVGGVGHGLPEA
ncbi:hypothetical protein D3C85_1887920 [compost metagenome]